MLITELFEPIEKVGGDFENAWAKIEQDCSEAINAVKAANNFFYRGHMRKAPDIFIEQPRSDRRSLSTPKHISQYIDKWFEENGFEVRRSNSVFVTGSRGLARTYQRWIDEGSLVIVFPTNGFKFSWSPKVRDLYLSVLPHLDIDHEFQETTKNPWDSSKDFNDIGIPLLSDLLKVSKYQTDNIVEALKSRNEIMITNTKLYSFDADKYTDKLKNIFPDIKNR